jgi:bifunctional DNase/RNase
LKITMRKALIETVDRVVIDTINRLREDIYNFAASIYLNNGQRIHDVMPSDAVIIALLANKSIYIDTTLL